ncbi:MAG: 16S rRNA (guanine(966)-N(2))-methyltransferase RsmD [Steroidobacteraceae bacterium]
MKGRGGASQQLRVIGGAWRGRRWRFASNPALRPTPDRVRETLFNWLAPRLPGARCLDLFAGSGALGIEALSRGAQHVVFIDDDAASAAALRELLATWPAPSFGATQPDPARAEVLHADALRWVARPRGAQQSPFDIVFLDPPFATDVLARCLSLLEQQDWLAPDAQVYVECPARAPLPELPPGWAWRRSRAAGEVGYHLAQRGARGVATEGE